MIIRPKNSSKKYYLTPIAAAVLTIASSPALSASDDHLQRHVALHGQTNFRDIGGYQAPNGQSVKWGVLYRSGELPRLTDSDLETLESKNIKTVISFLTEDEIDARGENRVPDEVNEVKLPIAGEDLAKVVLEARQTADFSKVPVSLNSDVHRLLVSETTHRQYAEFLRYAADESNHPLVFHCSHGVHRTGTATAVLLGALDVPWEVIRDDYLLSNEYRADEIESRISQLAQLAAETQGIEVEQVDMSNINAFYRLEGHYIDASYNEIIDTYGSFEDYVIDGLGLSQDELTQLRQTMLN